MNKKSKSDVVLQNSRYEKILHQLEGHAHVSVKALSQTLNVSEVTIRKDLSFLESNGHLYRTHGGATKKSYYAFEDNVSNKEHINTQAKQEIVNKTLEFIDENDCIILASGSTMHYLARSLQHFNKLTVLTASLRVAIELCKNPHIQIIQMGGKVRKSSTSVIGTFAEDLLKQFSCNKLFLGIDGISVDFGISTSNLSEATLNQRMIECTDKTYVLGDSSKIGKHGFGKICNLDQIDFFITDSGITHKEIEQLEKAGVSVIVCD